MNDSYGPPDFPPRQMPQMPKLPKLPELPFSPKLLFLIPIALILIIGGFTTIYQVEAEEVGVVTRFGRFQTIQDPGLRFKLPYGIDRVQKVAVERQLKQEFGFATEGATNRMQARDSLAEREAEKQMVTGDLNAALIEWVVQYRIQDPKAYLFMVRNADETLRDTSESVMREAVGDRTVDEVLTVGRQAIESEVLGKLQTLVAEYGMGLGINQVQLKNVDPPRQVQSSFNEVNNAQQQKEESINKANGQYNREVPKAGGEAQRSISDAEGYAIQRVNEAEGDAARFNALYTEYSKAPSITRQRLYLETMTKVVPALGNKIILDEDAKQLLPLLNLNQPPAPSNQ